MTKEFLLSIIIPVHNEEKNIEPLTNRLLKAIEKYRYELIFVDDGSGDKTLSLLKDLAHKNKNIKVLSFNRNFGHQVALECGYEHATGDAIITIDADLQDPPEVIDSMIKEWQNGAEIVYAKRHTRADSFFKRGSAHFFYRFLNFLSDTPIPTDVGDFRLQSKSVNEYLKNLPEHNKFMRGLVAWGGFRESYLNFDRDKRYAGKTNYTFSKMLNFALDGIISFSVKPLRIAIYMGFLVSTLGLLGIIYALVRRFFLPHEYWVTGWTALFVSVLFLGGTQLITIGIIGEYIARIYRESQNRPQYLLKEKVNC